MGSSLRPFVSPARSPRFLVRSIAKIERVLPVFVACVFSCVVACVVACDGRSRFAPPSPASGTSYSEPPVLSQPHVAEINIASGISEADQASLFGGPRRRSFADLVGFLTNVERGKEREIKGILVILGSAQPGFAQAQELARILGRIRGSGMPVVCHADSFGNIGFWFASNACDTTILSPAGEVDTVGIAGQTIYARKLLSDLRVDVDMLQVGKYKGASESFTRDGPSEEARESLMQTLTSMRSQWLEGIARANSGAENRVEDGPYSAKEAQGLGLVRTVGFLDEARTIAKALASVSQTIQRFGPNAQRSEAPDFAKVVRALSGAGGLFGKPHVAVLRASGAITMSGGGSLLSDSDGIAEREITRALIRLGKDESVRAVVLRIDSPGGSALASDLIWRQVMLLREVKPVVISIGSMAASGGYYIACAGTRIFAEPASIVGSIGVFGGKLSIERSLDHIGVSSETFPASSASGAAARAAYLSPFTSWDEATRQRVSVVMQSVYDLFLERVSEGRSMPVEKVSTFAEGKIFAAREGVALGMIDELGGLREATTFALAAGGLPPNGPVRLVEESGGLEKILELSPDDADIAGAAFSSTQREMVRSLAASAVPDGLLPFVEAWVPLLQGERTLVAVPFALLIR